MSESMSLLLKWWETYHGETYRDQKQILCRAPVGKEKG